MISDTELARIYQDIDSLDTQYRELSNAVASLRTSMDSMSIDSKSVTTSIQNLSMSIGTLKEKTDTVFNSLNMLSGSKDLRLDAVSREGALRIQDFKALCEVKGSSITSKLSSMQDTFDARIANVAIEARTASKVNSSDITKIETKINYAIYTGATNLVLLIGWLTKLLGASYGWWK